MIVCELMGKGGLLQYLTTRGRAKITGPDQLKFTKDICAGMCYLEAHNFVHRFFHNFRLLCFSPFFFFNFFFHPLFHVT